MGTRVLIRLSAVVIYILMACSLLQAQVTSVTNIVQPPIPGAGHDYIKMVNETVNPANGQVSIRISIPSPPGRQLSMPFGFAYDSGGEVHLESSTEYHGYIVWKSNQGLMSSGGWSYTAPVLSTSINYQPPAGYASDDPYHQPQTCEYDGAYMFEDMSGGQHQLFLSPAVNSNVEPPTYNPCFHDNFAALQPWPVSVLDAGDDYVRAHSGPWAMSRNIPPVWVADADGTVYSFGTPTKHQIVSQTFPGGSTSYATLADSITDRNGNQITLATDSETWQAPGYPSYSYSYTDTMERPVVSVSGFNDPSGDTVKVSGVGTFNVDWQLETPSGLPTGVTDHSLITGNTPNGYPYCGGIQSGAPWINVISEIDLPNGQSYRFDYDPTYGVLKQITYPDGGYIVYTWGINPRSEYIEYSDAMNSYPPNGVSGLGCQFQYDQPAVTSRAVYDRGGQLLEQQTFYYTGTVNGVVNGTVWSSNPPDTWTSKTVTILTQDQVASTSFYTSYVYSFVTQPLPPNQLGWTSNQIAVESTVSQPSKVVHKQWGDQNELACEDTQLLPGGQPAMTTYGYSPPLADNFVTWTWNHYGAQLASKSEYDFGTTCAMSNRPSPLRNTTITYESFTPPQNYPYNPAWPYSPGIFDKPSSQVVSGPIQSSETDYDYGGAGLANFTSITRKCLFNCSGDRVTQYTSDGYGNITSMTEPKCTPIRTHPRPIPTGTATMPT